MSSGERGPLKFANTVPPPGLLNVAGPRSSTLTSLCGVPVSAAQLSGKHERAEKVRELKERIQKEFLPADQEPKYTPGQVASALEALEERVVRDLILEGKRIDGRPTTFNVDGYEGFGPQPHGVNSHGVVVGEGFGLLRRVTNRWIRGGSVLLLLVGLAAVFLTSAQKCLDYLERKSREEGRLTVRWE